VLSVVRHAAAFVSRKCVKQPLQIATAGLLALLPMCESVLANSCAGSEDQQYTLQFEEAGNANPMMEMLMKVGCYAVWPSSFIEAVQTCHVSSKPSLDIISLMSTRVLTEHGQSRIRRSAKAGGESVATAIS
jgi:hypothetical protein